MNRETTSLKVDPLLWKLVKKIAVDLDLTVSDMVETALMQTYNIKEVKGIKERH